MDWYLIRYFRAVAELGNFSRAAGQMNVTQPTLSAGIAKLETRLGHRLFDRDRRRVSLTPAGSRFLVHAHRIAHDYEMALRDLSHTPQRRVLRVGMLSTIPTTIIETAVAQHQARGGAEDLEIIDGSERELREWLDNGGIDIALTILRSGSERFAVESLYTEDYVLTVPKNHRLAEAQIVSGEDLARDAMIIRRHCEALAATSRYFTQRGVRPNFGLKTTNDDRALALVQAGLGVTVMPETFRNSGIRHLKMVDFEMSREIGIIFSDSGKITAAKDSEFVDILRQLNAEQSTWRHAFR